MAATKPGDFPQKAMMGPIFLGLSELLSSCAIFKANAHPTAILRDELNAGGLERCDNGREIVADGHMGSALEVRNSLA